MRKIPDALRAEMDADPWMHRCCITGETRGKIEWHHALIHAGRQVNEAFAIVPLSQAIHERVHEQIIKDLVDWIVWNRATDEQIRYYSRAVNYRHRITVLNRRFGLPTLSTPLALQIGLRTI